MASWLNFQLNLQFTESSDFAYLIYVYKWLIISGGGVNVNGFLITKFLIISERFWKTMADSINFSFFFQMEKSLRLEIVSLLNSEHADIRRILDGENN